MKEQHIINTFILSFYTFIFGFIGILIYYYSNTKSFILNRIVKMGYMTLSAFIFVLIFQYINNDKVYSYAIGFLLILYPVSIVQPKDIKMYFKYCSILMFLYMISIIIYYIKIHFSIVL